MSSMACRNQRPTNPADRVTARPAHPNAPGVTYAGTHRAGYANFLQIRLSTMPALPSAMPPLSPQVCFKRRYFERCATDRGVHDTGLVGRYCTLTRFCVLDGANNIGADRADLRVRHQASRTEHLTERTDHAWRPGTRSPTSKVHEDPPLTRSARSSKPTTSAPAALASQPWHLARKHSDANGLAGTGRHDDQSRERSGRTSWHRCRVDSDVDGFIERSPSTSERRARQRRDKTCCGRPLPSRATVSNFTMITPSTVITHRAGAALKMVQTASMSAAVRVRHLDFGNGLSLGARQIT